MERREFFKTVLASSMGATIASKTSATPAGTRISVDESDSGYDPCWLTIADVEVFCDGKKIEAVLTADSKEGYVKYFDKSGITRFKEIHGSVKIKVNGRIYNG